MKTTTHSKPLLELLQVLREKLPNYTFDDSYFNSMGEFTISDSREKRPTKILLSISDPDQTGQCKQGAAKVSLSISITDPPMKIGKLIMLNAFVDNQVMEEFKNLMGLRIQQDNREHIRTYSDRVILRLHQLLEQSIFCKNYSVS